MGNQGFHGEHDPQVHGEHEPPVQSPSRKERNKDTISI